MSMSRSDGVDGVLFDGRSSRATAVRLEWQGRVVALVNGESREPLATDWITIPARLGTTPRRVSLGAGRIFECRDNDAIDRLDRWLGGGGIGGWVHWLERRPWAVAAALLMVAAALWFTVTLGVPLLSSLIAPLLPDRLERSLGDQSLVLLDRQLLSPSALSSSEQARVSRLLDRLVAGEGGRAVELHLRSGGELGANALALPGRQIVVTDELVALAGDEDQLAAVLAHELGHLELRHAMRQLLQSSLLAAVAVWVTGDPSSLALALPTMLLQLGYSREFEYEADRYAITRLEAVGIERAALSTILQALERQHGGGEGAWGGGYLSTHPATAERVKRIGAAD